MQSYHATMRQNERKIESSLIDYAMQLADSKNDCAVLIPLTEHRGDDTQDYYSRNESNGDLFCAIIRQGRLVTNFYRRSNQKNDCTQLRVNRVIWA